MKLNPGFQIPFPVPLAWLLADNEMEFGEAPNEEGKRTAERKRLLVQMIPTVVDKGPVTQLTGMVLQIRNYKATSISVSAVVINQQRSRRSSCCRRVM